MTTHRPKKPGKSLRGVAENPWGEVKQLYTTKITPTCKKNIKDWASKLGTSQTELLERVFRSPLVETLVLMEPTDPRYPQLIDLLKPPSSDED